MSKTVRKVFIVIGTLVLCLIVWNFAFGGGIRNVYNNGIRKPVNSVFEKVAGSGAELLPEWTSEDAGNPTTTLPGAGGTTP